MRPVIRPFDLVSQTVADMLASKGFKKGQCDKALMALAGQGKIVVKEFGKTKLFIPLQDGLEALSQEVSRVGEVTLRRAATVATSVALRAAISLAGDGALWHPQRRRDGGMKGQARGDDGRKSPTWERAVGDEISWLEVARKCTWPGHTALTWCTACVFVRSPRAVALARARGTWQSQC